MFPFGNGNYGGLANGFEGLDDPSLASPGMVDELNKALAAGSDINNPGSSPGEGFPLRMESLDSTLFNVTFAAKDIKFWRALYKDRAYNTIEEYNRLEGYGSSESIWMGEGDLPQEDDSEYSRQYTRIKFMGIVRRVTHVMTVIKAAHGDPVAREQVNGTLHLLRQVERSLFNGNEDLNPLQFDGLEKLLSEAWGSTVEDDGHVSGYGSDYVIDARGGPLTEDLITDLSEILVREPNYGAPSDFWTGTGPIKDISKTMYPKERVNLPAPKNGVAGVAIESILTPFGTIALNADIFIPQSASPSAAGVGKTALRATAPTITSASRAAYGGSNTNHWAASDAGDYYYKVVAVNKYGKSTPVTSSAVSVVAGDVVSVVIADNGSDTLYYEVSRSSKNGAASTCKHIASVARSAASQTWKDLNRFLPGTYKGYLLTQTSEVLKWKQLAPLLKLPLAQIDSSVRWMQLLYGALQVMAPRKCGMIINIGNLETGAYA
jgi:hypothetical protein